MKYNLITILGPTAVGKTRLAALLAAAFNGEIISADSRQVYRRMDIGTGKDLSDYMVNSQVVPYHLIDIIDPAEEFNLFQFQKSFYNAYSNVCAGGKIPFMVGGTGLYLHSILMNYELEELKFNEARFGELNKLDDTLLKSILLKMNPKLHNTTDLLVKERIIKAIMVLENESADFVSRKEKINSLTIGVKLERDEIKKRITARLKQRLVNGMIDEIKLLMTKGIGFDRLVLFGLEYKFIALYLKGELNYNDMYQKLNSAIHAFAKRQMTWFRKMEKEGIVINWINGADYDSAVNIIKENYF
jgi:tRNA dimethylallyltransferase